MRKSFLIVLFCGAAALNACGRGGARGGKPPEHHALNAGGEPQWSAQVRDDVLTFSTGDTLAFKAKVGFADHGRDGQSWTGQIAAANGAKSPVRLDAAPKPCEDPDTGMTYPFTATVQAPGGPYRGCAAPIGQGLGPRS